MMMWIKVGAFHILFKVSYSNFESHVKISLLDSDTGNSFDTTDEGDEYLVHGKRFYSFTRHESILSKKTFILGVFFFQQI